MLKKILASFMILFYFGLCSCNGPNNDSDNGGGNDDNGSTAETGGTPESSGVCDRTAEVLSNLLKATQKEECAQITAQDLAAIEELDMRDLTSVKSGDFAGLTSLKTLKLYTPVENPVLPPDLLAGLTALEELDLSELALKSLPEGFLTNLPALKRVDLSDNFFPAEVEAQLRTAYPNIEFTFGG